MGYGKVSNPWVGYVQRSYAQIKNSVLTKLGAKVPELTDHSESNPLVIILSIFSGVAEMLGYYIDNMAAEAFISTARRFSSAVKFTKLIDYRIRAINPASADLLVKFQDSGGNSVAAGVSGTFNTVVTFTTGNGTVFTVASSVDILSTDTEVVVPVEQKVLQTSIAIGTTDGNPDQLIAIGTDYVDGSMTLLVDGNLWELVDTFGFSGPTDQHYIIEIGTDNIAYIKFGDDTNGAIPGSGLSVVGTYYSSDGLAGMVDANTITNGPNGFIAPLGWAPTNYEITNPLATAGGTDYENLASIKRRAPLSIRTLDRAVTKQDYQDVAELAPGVFAAAVFYSCGKNVVIYIAAENGGIAQQALLDSSKAFIDERKMVTTNVTTEPAGITELVLNVDVYGKVGVDAAAIQTAVEAALLIEWSYDNSYINRPFRVSDVTALIDNLAEVDYLDINKIATIPYMRPDGHTTALLYTASIIDPVSAAQIAASQIKSEWVITYIDATTKMQVVKDSVLVGLYDLDTPYSAVGDLLDIEFTTSAYTNGEIWKFTTYPINENIEFDDFTVPQMSLVNLTVSANEQTN